MLTQRARDIWLLCVLGMALASTGCPRTEMFPNVTVPADSCSWSLEKHPRAGYAQLVALEEDNLTHVRAVATISVQSFPSHEQAKARLLAISTESLTPSSFAPNSLWPTLVRQYTAPAGGLNAQRLGSLKGDLPALTVARAAGNKVIRVEGRARPEEAGLLASLKGLALGLSVTDAGPQPADHESQRLALEALAEQMRPIKR